MFRNNLSNKKMEGYQSQDKSYRTREKLHTFYNIYIKAIKKDTRPNIYFDKAK